MSTYRVFGRGETHFFDPDSYRDIVTYITNPQKAAFTGGCNVSGIETAAAEMQQVAKVFGKDCGKRVRHSELSFSECETVTPEMANEYAQHIIEHYAPEYQIVYAVHTNTNHLHIHFAMNQISFVDGHRYQGKKDDYYRFMAHIRSVTHLVVIPVK